MKLLFDQNLPASALRAIETHFPGSEHVIPLGLDSASDLEIYQYARNNEFTIISKDSDFRQLSFVLGAPPKVIWLRIGNCTVRELSAVLSDHIGRIHAFDSELESFLVIE